jgi:anaerobic ribonucleoside-triphosphate reductase
LRKKEKTTTMSEVKCSCGKDAEKATSPHTNIEYWVCHECQKTIGRVTEVYSRCCGYLRPVQQWNKGKAQEFKERKEYTIKRA